MSTTAQVACPKCGYASSRIVGTIRLQGRLRRTRRCLRPPAQPGGGTACGLGFCTYEVTAEEHELLTRLRAWYEKSLTRGA